MPGFPEIVRTSVGVTLCDHGQALKRGCSRSPSLTQDVVRAQQMAQLGVAEIENALAYVLDRGKITPSQEQELTECLGTIAIGKCPHFPATPYVVKKA